MFSPQVFEGHPFIVEAGISIGGKDVKHVMNQQIIYFIQKHSLLLIVSFKIKISGSMFYFVLLYFLVFFSMTI